MKYSRSKLNLSGKALLAGPETGFPFTDANLVVEDWRKLHMVPLKELQDAYPSYFLNAGEFIDSLQDFNNMCLSKHYL